MYRAQTDPPDPEARRADEADQVWRICVAIGEARRSGRLVPGATDLALRVAFDASIDAAGESTAVPGPAAVRAEQAPAGSVGHSTPHALARWSAAGGWMLPAVTEPAGRDLLALYRPLLELRSFTTFVLVHLGQSIDGQIATRTGDSRFVNCAANITHLHRLRALCDAVIVGRETATLDDPLLTTRHVTGPNPVRVVLDPDLRLPSTLRLLTDHPARTLVVCAPEHLEAARRRFGESRVIGVGRAGAQFDLAELRTRLAGHGLYVLFVEGGGVTVSRFIEQGAADRLHLAVAPVLAGAGRSGLQIAGAPLMRDNLRPPHRVFQMGIDVLWDFDMRGPAQAQPQEGGPPDTGIRIIR